MGKQMELQIVEGPLAGQRIAVPPSGLRFGRSSTNDLHASDGELSRTHCLFEVDGEDALKVTDLASANGTFVNGNQLGADPFRVRHGDVVEAGATKMVVFNPSAPQTAPKGSVASVTAKKKPMRGRGVDLGLAAGGSAASAGGAQGGADAPQKRSKLVNILWCVAIASIIAAIAVILLMPAGKDPSRAPSPVVTLDKNRFEPVTSLYYEKVEADATRIFRYQMTVDADGVLRVIYDDVPGENRHVDKSTRLSDQARERIAEIFSSSGWRDLDGEYTGYSPDDENSMKRKCVRVISGGAVKEVVAENATEPEALAAVVSALEAFSRNELGIWALQYTRDQLIQLSADIERVGDTKWEDRNVEYGNLNASVKAYREALFYLETVNPKPDRFVVLRDKLQSAVAELDKRYKEQRFLADKAINLGNWEVARLELRTLCDLVPDTADERHVEAKAKLVDVENRLAASKKGGNK